MAWFKVDDRLTEHRKFRALRRGNPDVMRDIAPLGLWVAAGAWAEDGFVPFEVMEEWDDRAREYAARLVACGLWVYESRDGEQGCRFHDWDTLNPSSSSSSKGAEGNHLRWHVNRGIVAPNCSLCNPDLAPDIAPESGGESGGDIATESGGESPAPPRPAPTKKRTSSSADAADGDFEVWWSMHPRKVGKGQARRAYTGARKKTDAATLLDAIGRFAEQHKGTDPRFIPHPATWLNGERWLDAADEPPADPWEAFRGYNPDAPTEVHP